jgi:hypothetical protein
VQAGWNDAARIAKDPLLELLRDRDDFKKLVAEVAARQSPCPPHAADKP